MRDGFALYLRYLALSVRSQLQYRADLLLKILGQLLVTGIEFVGIWALFHRFGTLAGWTLAEIAFLYGTIDVGFAISEALGRGFDCFAQMVRTGDFDRLLLRPRSTVLQLLGQELTLRRAGRLVQGLGFLAWAGSVTVDWTAGRAALLVFAVAGVVCLFLGLVVLEATTAFWTVETLEAWNAFTYGGNYAAQYPMSIYGRWFRRFFTVVVPLACVVYFPALVILGRAEATPLHAAAPLAGVAFLAVAFLAWRVGVRHYTSTGS